MGFGSDGGTLCNTGQITTSGTAAAIITANTTQSRVSLTLTNTSTSASPISMYVGGTSGVLTTTGHAIPPATSWTTTYRGPLWVIGGAGTLTYFEEVNA